MSQFTPGKPVFPALPLLSSRGWTHTTVARGTALWESLVGKPRGKATDPLIHAKGSTTQPLQLGRKAHVQAQVSQSIPEGPVFPALPRLSRRGSTHTTVELGTALWERLRWKPGGKATDPLIHPTGSKTLLLQLGRKAHVHAPTRDED